MKIIISPAKKMRVDNDCLWPKQLPVFIEKADLLKDYLKGLSLQELQALLHCNEKIALLNYERYQKMDLRRNLSAAILSYDGIQYQYMAPQVFENAYFAYIEEHLRILSGFYGILKPFDGITPYRLEMQAKLHTGFCHDLYDFWGSAIYEELIKKDSVILNLASQEYSKTVTKYLGKEIRCITCIFGEAIGGKVKEKGVYVKMARGEMVRFMAENAITEIEDIKTFHRLGFCYQKELSNDQKFVFVKECATTC